MCGLDPLPVKAVQTPEVQAGVLLVGLRLRDQRLGRRQIRLRLPDLVARLRFLIFQIGSCLCHLLRGLLFAARIIRQVGLPLPGLNQRQQLAAPDHVAFLDPQLLHPSLDFRTHDHVVGGHNAGEGDFTRPGSEDPAKHDDDPRDDQPENEFSSFHVRGASGFRNRPCRMNLRTCSLRRLRLAAS